MGTTHTEEEARQNYITAMGNDLGKHFHALWGELVLINYKWSEYVELYGTNQERIDLLNKATPIFFKLVYDLLFEDTLLGISRITDPANSGGKKANLTIQGFSQHFQDQASKSEVERLVAIALTKSEFCRTWRNKRLAHRDLEIATKDGVTLLPAASRKMVKDALDSIGDVLNYVATTFDCAQTAFNFVWPGQKGSNFLLQRLNDGLRANEAREKRLLRGEYTEDDLKERVI